MKFNLISKIFLVKFNFYTVAILTFFFMIKQIIGQPYNYQFEFYRPESGLKYNTNCMVEDSRGFLWIGTRQALYKYNGYDFEEFCNDQLDSTSISNNYINCMVKEKENILWLGTQNGLNKFNIFTKKSDRFFHSPSDTSSLSDSYITSLYIDTENILWIGTQSGGLNKVNLNNIDKQSRPKIKFQHFMHNPEDSFSISNNHINSILVPSKSVKNELWVATITGLNIFNKYRNKFKRYYHNSNNKNSLPSNGTKTLFEDKKGVVWIGTNDGYISKVEDPSDIYFENFFIGNKSFISSINEDDKGNLWIGALQYSLLKFNKKNKRFSKLVHLKKNTDYYDQIANIFFDSHKRMWVASRWGLHKYDPNDKRFNYYPLLESMADVLSFALWQTGK